MRKRIDFLAYHLDSLLIFLYNTVLPMLAYVLWTYPVSEINVFFWVLCAAVFAEGNKRKQERKDLRALEVEWFHRGISAPLITYLSIFGMFLAAPDIYTGWMWLGILIYAGYLLCGILSLVSLGCTKAKSLLSGKDGFHAEPSMRGLTVIALCQGACQDREIRENIFEMLRTVEGQEFFLQDLREANPVVKRRVVDEIFLCFDVEESTAEEAALTLFAFRLALYACIESYCAGEIASLLPDAERRLACRMIEAFPEA